MKIFEIILFRFFLYSTIPIVGYIIETWVEVSKHQRAGFMLILLLPLLIPLLIIVPFWYLTIFRRVGFATKNRNKKNRGFVIPDEADAVFETDTTSEGTTTKRYYLWKIEHAFTIMLTGATAFIILFSIADQLNLVDWTG